MALLFDKIVIVGVGMIGGSLALAARKKKVASEIIGIDIDTRNLNLARKSKMIDYGLNLHSRSLELEKAGLIIIATPVTGIVRAVKKILPALDKGTIITDTGSVKAPVVKGIENILPKGIFFVGGHPIAGSEQSGVKAASEGLFAGTKTILTPGKKHDPSSLKKVTRLWERIGSRVILMKPEEHDKIFAAVSHLPHILAFSLVNTLSNMDLKNRNPFNLAGGGFKDFTRIAQSNPLMWHDIVLENKKEILTSMNRFISTFNKIKKSIENAESSKIKKEFSMAQKIRKKLN